MTFDDSIKECQGFTSFLSGSTVVMMKMASTESTREPLESRAGRWAAKSVRLARARATLPPRAQPLGDVGYDWHLNVKPTLCEIAESQGAGWMPGKLLYFDKPIARRYHARALGHLEQPWRSKLRHSGGLRLMGNGSD
jgi:hypothetical protein